jgi:hypothetical protein
MDIGIPERQTDAIIEEEQGDADDDIGASDPRIL